MKKIITSLLAAIICVSMICAIPVEAAYYNTYSTVAKINNRSTCTAMQGLAVGSKYMYTVKINSADTKATLAKTNKDTGAVTILKNSSGGSTYLSYLGHANDMCVTTLNDKSTLFIATMKDNNYALVKIAVSGSKFTKKGNYTIKLNGKKTSVSGVSILSKTSSKINFLFKKGKNFYTGSLGLNSNSGTINITKAFSINTKAVTINGKVIDASSYTHQGFGYYKNYVFVPLTDLSKGNVSIIAVYNIKNASGTIKTVSNLSFRITSKSYSLFEIESCGICSKDGKLYFNTNRAKSGSSTCYDAIHAFKKYSF